MEVDEQINYMRLGGSALVALDVFESSMENAPKTSAYSLFDLLNKTRTVGGKHLLESWLKHPLCDLARIVQRHDVVEALNEASECRDALHKNYLRRVHDVVPMSQKLTQGKAKLDDCYRLYQSICALGLMIDQLGEVESCNAVQELILNPLKQSACELEKMRELIEGMVVFNETAQRYCVKPDVDENLVTLTEELERLRTKAEAIAVDLRSETGAENMKLETNSENGFFFRVTLKSEKNVRNADIITLSCTKGVGMTFTNSKLQSLNDTFCDLNAQYDEAQREVEAELIQACCSYAAVCQTLGDKLALLDVLVSFSVFCCGSPNPYVRPELYEQGSNIFELSDCRHPIAENIPFAPTFIPNDVAFDHECRFITLTGPNTGGKSTFLKATAVTVLLAQIGCFVPCSSARLSLVDSILCRVGAGDIQFKGVSTFMAEMQDVAKILNEATENSLVIIDELGRGTSTFDGFGLVYTVSEEIVCKIKSFTILATHFHEMAQLKHSYPAIVRNLKVDTYLDEEGTMTILYKIIEGVSDKSFGISIARQVGFSEDIVKDAEEILDVLEKSSVTEKELNARRLINSCQQMNAQEIRFMLENLPDEQL